jgi:hypothetical protein
VLSIVIELTPTPNNIKSRPYTDMYYRTGVQNQEPISRGSAHMDYSSAAEYKCQTITVMQDAGLQECRCLNPGQYCGTRVSMSSQAELQ